MRHRSRGYRTGRCRSRLAIVATLSWLLLASPAHADKSSRAAELFKGSAAAYRRGEFQSTVDLLKQAYALDPQPVMLYNLGRAYEGLGHHEAAIAAYRQYLSADPKAADRASIEQRVATLERTRDERAALEKQRDEERKRAEEAAQRAADEQRRADEEHRRAQQTPPRERSAAPYVVAGVGAAGLGAGGVFGLLANGKHDDAASARVHSVAVETQDQAKTYATVSTVSLIAGGVLLAAGITWWVLDAPRAPRQGASPPACGVGLGPGGVTFEGSF